MTGRRKRLWPRIILAAIGLLIVLIGLAVFHRNQHTKTAATKATVSMHSSQNSNTIHVLAAGDFLANDTVNEAAKQSDGTYDYLPMMSQFVPVFDAADIRFCNDAQLNGGPQFGISGWPTFNSPSEFAPGMANVGCNLVNDGTNHSFDRNQAAINATQDTWDKVPHMLAVVGQNRNMAEHNAVHYFTIKGVKFAFLAYTTYLNTDAPAQNDYGVNVFSKSFAASQIATAKQNGAKFIIASMRWGVEYSANVSDEQKADAQWLADQGVNLVFGHGSHVLEPAQELTGSSGNKTLVWYSLGDFIGSQIPANTLFNGLAAMDINAKTLQITNVSFLPIYMHYDWTAAEAQRQNNDDLLARGHLKMYFLDQTTQAMIDAQQLKTTVSDQSARLSSTLNTYMSIPLINEQQYKSKY